MTICANPKCRKVTGNKSPSPYFCSDNCGAAWTAQHWGIDQFPTPERASAQVLPRWTETPLPWLEGK